MYVKTQESNKNITQDKNQSGVLSVLGSPEQHKKKKKKAIWGIDQKGVLLHAQKIVKRP